MHAPHPQRRVERRGVGVCRCWGVTFALLATATVASGGCKETQSAEGASPPPGELVRSAKARSTQPVPEADMRALTDANAAFGLDVLEAAARDDNFFFSPHSLSIALAMTYAGARERTATQMAKALRFTLPAERLHPAFGALDLALARRSAKPVESGRAFHLAVLDRAWGQKGYTFLGGYLDVLAEHYGAGMSLLDFARDPDAARAAINGWVSASTREKIPELIPVGVVSSATVLVLTNAITFEASWKDPFEASATRDEAFTKLDRSTVIAPAMHQTKLHRYAEGDGWQALELAYVGDDVTMLVVLPAKDTFRSFRSRFDGAMLSSVVAALGERSVDVTLPRFRFRTPLSVRPTLEALGMVDAFQSGVADLSGMDGTRSLFVQAVVHEAFVAVDERGTEAAAATAVVVGRTSAPERATFAADRPFLLAIRDNATGAVLFLGQVTSP